MTTRSGPAVSGTSRHKYCPGFRRLKPNASNMSSAACEAASLASIFASKVSSANAGVGMAEVARTHDPASASAVARRFMIHLTLLLTLLGEMHRPRVGFLDRLLFID